MDSFELGEHVCISNNPESKQEELIAENKSHDEKNAEIEEKIRGPPGERKDSIFCKKYSCI